MSAGRVRLHIQPLIRRAVGCKPSSRCRPTNHCARRTYHNNHWDKWWFSRPGFHRGVENNFVDNFFKNVDRFVVEANSRMPNEANSRMSNRPVYEAYGRRPWKNVQVNHNNNLYEVKLDVQNFNPEDVIVKLAGNNLTVSAESKVADELGSVARVFKREFALPEDVKLDTLKSSISEDSILIIEAEVEGGASKQGERIVEIQRDP